jgi:hypothetical protein
VLVAGSASCSPLPVRRLRASTLFATFTDAEMGGGAIVAAEYSTGAAPAPAGSGVAMTGPYGSPTVQASAPLETGDVLDGTRTYWVRGRDAAGNWSAATAVTVPTSGSTTVSGDEPAAVDFLAPPSPNPLRSSATIRFGLARAGEVRLELFDVSGRRVRTVASGVFGPGAHVAAWDGRDHQGHGVKSGVFFLRLTTPSRVFHDRVVVLR